MAKTDTTREIGISVRHRQVRVERTLLRRVIAALDEASDRFEGGCPLGELSLAILSDEALARLHGDFLDDPTRTDVITFEGEPLAGLAGEICVSADTALRVARERRSKPSEELTLYVVHGWLHLAGYDDLQPRFKRRMRAAEARAMKILREQDLLGAFRFEKR